MSERERGPRVLVAVGERGLEGRLTRELAACGIAVAGRCLDGPSLAESASAPGVDVVLAAPGLHRLTEETLLALRGRGLPVVLLAGPSDDIDRLAALGRCVPASSGGAVVAQALREAQRRGAGRGRPPRPEGRGASGAASREGAGVGDGAAEREEGRLLAVAGARGAPGATTLAVALAALLSARSDDVVLLDADLRGGNVAPCARPRSAARAGRAPGGGSGPRASGASPRSCRTAPASPCSAASSGPALGAGLREGTLPVALSALRELNDRVGSVDLPGYGVSGSGPSRPDAVLRAADLLLLVVTGPDLSLPLERVASPPVRPAAPSREQRGQLAAVLSRRQLGARGALHGSARRGGARPRPPRPRASVREDAAERAPARRRAPASRSPRRLARRAGDDVRALAAGAPRPRPPSRTRPPRPPRTAALLPSLATGSLRWWRSAAPWERVRDDDAGSRRTASALIRGERPRPSSGADARRRRRWSRPGPAERRERGAAP